MDNALDIAPEQILDVLRAQLPERGLYVDPDIPAKKMQGAGESCELRPGERILGIVDCTVFGSAKHHLLFREDGIAFHSRNGSGSIPYKEFPTRSFQRKGMYFVDLGNGQSLDMSGSGCSKDKLISILTSIRSLMGGAEPEHAAKPEPVTAPVTSPAETTEQLGPFTARVIALLGGQSLGKKFFIGADMPAERLATARGVCRVPAAEQIVAMVDFTFLRSGIDSLLFGTRGVYHHCNHEGQWRGFLAYQDISSRSFEWKRGVNIDLGEGEELNVGWSIELITPVLKTLQALQQLAKDYPDEVPDVRTTVFAEQQAEIARQIAADDAVRQQLREILDKHMDTAAVETFGFAYWQTLGTRTSTFLKRAVVGGLIGGGLGGRLLVGTKYHVGLVAVTSSDLHLVDLATSTDQHPTLDQLRAYKSAAITTTPLTEIKAESKQEEGAGVLVLNGKLSLEAVFPPVFTTDNAQMSERIAEAIVRAESQPGSE